MTFVEPHHSTRLTTLDYNPDQPRASDGKFGSGGSSKKKKEEHKDVSKMTAKEINKELKEHGYMGPTSYTKTKLGEILKKERDLSDFHAGKSKEDLKKEAIEIFQAGQGPALFTGSGASGQKDTAVSTLNERGLKEYVSKFGGEKYKTGGGKSDPNAAAPTGHQPVGSSGKPEVTGTTVDTLLTSGVGTITSAYDPNLEGSPYPGSGVKTAGKLAEQAKAAAAEMNDPSSPAAEYFKGMTAVQAQHEAIDKMVSDAKTQDPQAAGFAKNVGDKAHALIDKEAAAASSISGSPKPSTGPVLKDINKMTAKEINAELKTHGYKGPTSYTKTKLGDILMAEREKAGLVKPGSGKPAAPVFVSPIQHSGPVKDTDVRQLTSSQRNQSDKISMTMASTVTAGERQAIKSYSGIGYSGLNDALRTGKDLTPAQKKTLDGIESACKKQDEYYKATGAKPPQSMFRIIHSNKYTGKMSQHVAKEYPPGKEFSFKSPTSASEQPGVFGSCFNNKSGPFGAGDSRLTFEILPLPKGHVTMTTGSLTNHASEREHLFSKDARYKVIGMKEVPVKQFGGTPYKTSVLQIQQIA